MRSGRSWFRCCGPGIATSRCGRGNYLQHSVEIAAADRLAVENPDALHIALAHGMAPFECFERKLTEKVQDGSARQHYLRAALRQASQAPRPDEPSIVTAYRNTRARDDHYPNSAELLRERRGGCGLSGGITEKCPVKYEALARAWRRSPVKVACASWRSQLHRGGVLACPKDLQAPWLFTMDPMTYRVQGGCDDDNLYDSDMELLSKGLAPFVGSGQPGIALLFVYNVDPEHQCAFWQFTEELARRTSSGVRTCSLVHRSGNRNLAALLHAAIDVPADFIGDAVEEIEDAALAAAMQAGEREFTTRERIMSILENDGGNALSAKLRA